ncbi:MAG: membrane protein insertase YidC [Paludibacteraceae bacterium]|nr:membrane protein insertase YidC [Paludibacteraceae bacterium]
MDRNTWIGFLLIAAIIVGFTMLSRPSKEELAERQRINDSIALVHQMEAEALKISAALAVEQTAGQSAEEKKQTTQDQIEAVYGPFAPSAQGESKMTVLENSKVRLFIDSKGGYIARAELKEYKAYGDSVNDLCLFRGDESELAFTLITSNNRIISTKNLYFEPVDANESQVTMRLRTTNEDAWLDFVYGLNEDDYMVHFRIEPHNTQAVLAQNVNSIEMQWRQLIVQQERGRKFEERYAQLQYMLVGGDMEKLSESKAATKRENARIRWIAYKDQFFSTVLIADDAFTTTALESTPQAAQTKYIKEYKTSTSIAFDVNGQKATSFRYFFGPNHYNTL